MFIPETISKNTICTYTSKSHNVHRKSLNAQDFCEWHERIPKRLNILCIICIASNWIGYPYMDEFILEEDQRVLLDLLPTNLPLQLTIPKIKDDIYWKRCFKTRWPNRLPLENLTKFRLNRMDVSIINKQEKDFDSTSSGQGENFVTWKRSFVEMYLEDLLENLKPEDYDPEQIKILIELFRKYIYKLRLNQLQAPLIHSGYKNRIPLTAILSGLTNLLEFSVCFKQSYVKENFMWHIMETTMDDIFSLTKGLNKSNLRNLSIINSDINCHKLEVMLHGLLCNKELVTIDFSHCKIGDKGIESIATIILEIPSIEELILKNNLIGPAGIGILFIAIRQRGLKQLDLSLNNLGIEGCELLARNIINESCYIEKLYLSGCGLTKSLEFCKMIGLSVCLKEVDISNNKLGPEMGLLLLEGLKQNRFLGRLDIRMCAIPSPTFFAIESILAQCRTEKRRTNKC